MTEDGPPEPTEDERGYGNQIMSQMPEFGVLNPQDSILGLKSKAERPRGFLTSRDRSYLIERDLEDQTERHARMDIRKRVTHSYLDFQYLSHLPDRDRKQVFQNAADDYELNLRNGIKEFVKFTHHALRPFDIDHITILERAIREAEEEAALQDGELFEGDISFSLNTARRSDLTGLVEKFRNHEQLYPNELEALINNADVDIQLIDALTYQARSLWGSASPDGVAGRQYDYSWGDPDASEYRAAVDDLQELIEQHELHSLRDFETEWKRLIEVGGSADHALHECTRTIDKEAPVFDEQLASESLLREKDMKHLHRILWNPEKEPVEEVVEDMAKPPMAGEEWAPSDSVTLQRFIARVEVARESSAAFASGGERGEARWQRVVELAAFDPDEWEEYIHEEQIRRCAARLEEIIDPGAHSIQESLAVDGTWEDFWRSLPQSKAQLFHAEISPYEPDVIEAALDRLATNGDGDA